MWSAFKDKFLEFVDKHIPFKERRIKASSEQWINDDILIKMHQRDYLHQKALQHNSDYYWKLYKRARNLVVSKIREAKRTFVDEAINQAQTKPKDMWTRLKQFLPSQCNKIQTLYLQIDDTCISQNDQIADAFNYFFCNIGHNLGKNFDDKLPDVEQLMSNGSFKIQKMSVDFVTKQISGMSTAKATWLDGISVKLLKLTSNAIVDILTCVFNFSMETNNFENDWKRAKVSPIFKNVDEHMANNYRPVSVLPIISKIIEKHVFNSFYLSENHLITSSQSGFRPKHSSETALNCLIDRCLKNIDQGKLTGVPFIDLSKAFDTVNHNVLIHKLKSFGICENTVSWFKSYLSSREKSVGWKGVISKPNNITIGVPQGSILGPLFFILFVNDYPKCLKYSNVTIYADDTSQDATNKYVDTIEKKLICDLKSSMNWMNENKLTMNLKKTQCMLVGTKQIVKM
jgi:hypothetical protein